MPGTGALRVSEFRSPVGTARRAPGRFHAPDTVAGWRAAADLSDQSVDQRDRPGARGGRDGAGTRPRSLSRVVWGPGGDPAVARRQREIAKHRTRVATDARGDI